METMVDHNIRNTKIKDEDPRSLYSVMYHTKNMNAQAETRKLHK